MGSAVGITDGSNVRLACFVLPAFGSFSTVGAVVLAVLVSFELFESTFVVGKAVVATRVGLMVLESKRRKPEQNSVREYVQSKKYLELTAQLV